MKALLFAPLALLGGCQTTVTTPAAFSLAISLRAVKLGKDGFSATGGGDTLHDGDTVTVEKTNG